MNRPRILAIMGSGETAPTMLSVHTELLRRLGPRPRPVMLDTPFGFQENADELAAKSVTYFAERAQTALEVATFRDAETATPMEYERMCASLAQADYVFAGPGSPSYALRQWRGTRVPSLLVEKLRDGGIVVFASAAAVGLGEVALPVYEIYKVGETPRWIEGLHILAATGVRAAVIPHYSNAEGGTHDTRYCYMGERRLRVLEEQLPDGCHILGVDEHTAAIIDLQARTLSVRGRGRVVWRVLGEETSWTATDVVPLDDLAAGLPAGARAAPSVAAGGDAATQGAPEPLLTEVAGEREAALDAIARGDVDAAVAAALRLESSIHEWSSDAGGTDAPERARAVLREVLVSMGELARRGTSDPKETVAPLVGALLTVRDRARSERRFADADAVREALTSAGVEVRDTPAGSTWVLVGSANP
ncbi:MAG: CysS/YqeB C-terminal domain-containing protein [Candidatus Dormibacteria bacterium]